MLMLINPRPARKRPRRRKKNPPLVAIGAAVLAAAAAAGVATYIYTRQTKKNTTVPPRGPGKTTPKAVTPSLVPSYVKIHAPITDGWEFYSWYSYQGNAPRRMWIRVDWRGYDSNTTIAGVDPDGNIVVAAGQFRWVVMVGDSEIPMGLEVVDRQLTVICSGSVLPWATGCAEAYAEVLDDDGNYKAGPWKRFVEEWIIPAAGQLTARAAADWIDAVYTIPAVEV